MSGGTRGGRRSRCRNCRWPVEEFVGVGCLHVPYPWLGADTGTDEPAWCATPAPSAVITPPNQDDEPPPWR